jgi:hypothetical protein
VAKLEFQPWPEKAEGTFAIFLNCIFSEQCINPIPKKLCA